MSVSSDYKLAKIKIIWSNQKYLLKEFVETFNLPQVVLVKDGYCGEDERTTFGRDQILTLHQLRETNKIVCQTAKGNVILLPSKSEIKAQVLPMNFKNVNITAKQLIETYKTIKYLRVSDVGTNLSDDPKNLFQPNDTLEIIESNSAGIRCRNLSANYDSFIPSRHLAKFVPLSEPNLYTLAEIKAKYGFPVKIWFPDREDSNIIFLFPGSKHSTTNLCSLGQLTVVEEIQENDVIVTTVCSSVEEKICVNVPIDLDIKVTVAEGFLKRSQTYAKVVQTLDKELKKSDLKAFDDLDVYQHVHEVKKQIKERGKRFSVKKAPSKVAEHARQQLQIHEKMKQLSKIDETPKVQHRLSISFDNILPKISPKVPKKIQTMMSKQQTPEKHEPRSSPKNWTRPENSYDLEKGNGGKSAIQTIPLPQVPSKMPNLSTKPSSNAMKENEEEILYEDMSSPKIRQNENDRESIYEAMYRYPQDLSSLSVTDVSQLLEYLEMKEYVKKFEKEMIDGSLLITMDKGTLDALNVDKFHSRKLLEFIGGWRPKPGKSSKTL